MDSQANRQSPRETTNETEVSLQKHKIGKHEYKCTQQDPTTQSNYSLGCEERDITNMGLMTQHSEHTSQSTRGSLTCLSTDI